METELSHVSFGPCGSCKNCRDAHGWKLSQDDFELDTWTERDRAFIGIRDKATQQFHAVEMWDDEAREFVEDIPGSLHGDAWNQRVFSELWECVDLSIVPDDVRDAAFSAKVSAGEYIDEGGIGRHCDMCACTLQKTLYDAHGIGDDGELIHLQACEDCMMAHEYGDDAE